ncbi:MAG: ornithine carbamoyltransferase, partial [Vicinamibacterales bacterium]
IQTLSELWGSLKGRTVAFVGDGNNVATSMVHASVMLGVSVRIATPKGYELPNSVLLDAARVATEGAEVVQLTDPKKAVEGADAIYTDAWTSMGQEVEYAERKKIFSRYQVNDALMSRAKPSAIFMHCLPAHRGEEVAEEVIESSRSVVFDQAENRLHAQKALLLMLIGG